MFCMKKYQDKIITLFLQLNTLYLEDLVGFLNLFNALSNLQEKCQEFTISSSWVARKYNFQPLAFCSTPRWFDNSLTVARLSSANKQMNFTNSIFSTHYFLKKKIFLNNQRNRSLKCELIFNCAVTKQWTGFFFFLHLNTFTQIRYHYQQR